MRLRIPDWLIYFLIVWLVYLNALRNAAIHDAPQPPPPPELGPILPSESPRDHSVMVSVDSPKSGLGTAFAIDHDGHWLTARHVVDGCQAVGIHIGKQALKANTQISPDSDTAILSTDWKRQPLKADLNTPRHIGELGFFFGFPQGKPGEIVGELLGRHRLIVRGRYDNEEPILAWTEIGRTRGLVGSLGGLSGAPVLDIDGEVIGLVSAESIRRGRVYTVAPRNLRELITDNDDAQAETIELERYGQQADRYRRDRRITKVICLVE